MEKIDLILSIIASIVSIISAAVSYNYYKKIVKISNKINTAYSKNKQTAGNKATQIIGKNNKVK